MPRCKMVFHSILILGLLFLCWGCSGGGGIDPVLPVMDEPAAQHNGTTGLWGLWHVAINPDTLEADVVSLRQADLALNVLSFLEPPAMSGMALDFSTLQVDSPNKTVSADVILTHPLNTPEDIFHGFDVRGIVIGPRLLNADGHTPVMNPADFSVTPFGYIDGLLGAPDSFANYDGVWGYKYFCDDLSTDANLPSFFGNPSNLSRRGIFEEWQENKRHYEISWVNSGYNFLVFNYAVYANYNWPTGPGPYDISDFDITTANSQEAFCGDITNVASSLYTTGTEGGGTVSLDIEVWDWQGLDNSDVTLQILGLSDTPVLSDSYEAGTTAYSRIYHFVNASLMPLTIGECDLLVKVEDEKTFGESWLMGLLGPSHALYGQRIWNGFVTTVPVYSCPSPLVTSINPDHATAGEVLDDVVVTGEFIDGPSLGVRIELDDKPVIEATDVIFVDANTITCDLDLEMAWDGTYDVVVTNGCGNEAAGEDMFEVEGGITLVIDGNLPFPQPYCSDIQFSVVGDDTYNHAGVYYMSAMYAVYYYPLDYSTVGSLYMILQGNFGYTMYTLVGASGGLGKIEVDSTGGVMLTSNNTTVSWDPEFLCNQPIFWWRSNIPQLSNDIVLQTQYAVTRSRDIEAEFEVADLNKHVLWGFYAVEEDYNYDGNDVEIVNLGVGYPFGNDHYTPYLDIDWGPLDETPGGSLDGEVSDEEAYRLAIDSDPTELDAQLNIIFYYLEGSPDDNVIEVIASNRGSKGDYTQVLTTIEGVFEGTAVDISVLPSAGDIPVAEHNWLVVLEDNGDLTWQIALFDPDGSLIERSVAHNGDPLGVDCDSTNNRIHVWVDDAAILKYYVFEWV